MGFFSDKTSMRKINKRMQKANEEHRHSTRMEYLLNENTPFNVTEAFRDLKVQLSVSVAKKKGGTVIMATSSYPTEGKTTVTSNLALMFAYSNVKVLLIDADIRKGRVHKYFKGESTPGLSDYLSGQNTLDEVTHATEVNPNLFYIPCGTRSPKPYELLESEEMKELLTELRGLYDYIIIDTPPILVISDALAIAANTDGVVFICRHQSSYLSDISRSLKVLQTTKANILGVVVNDYTATASSNFYGDYKKYYYYDYVEEGETPKQEK